MSVSRTGRVVPVPEETCMFVCDVQSGFKNVIYGFEEITYTINKMVRMCTLLKIPVIVTEQAPKNFGSTDPAVAVDTLGELLLGTVPKTMFSMVTPETKELLKKNDQIKAIVIVGLESHICVLQTALDLKELGYSVYVLADGVSSCNREEVPIALSAAQAGGARVVTSESVGFMLMRDSASSHFRPFAKMLKEEKERTAQVLQKLPGTSVKSVL